MSTAQYGGGPSPPINLDCLQLFRLLQQRLEKLKIWILSTPSQASQHDPYIIDEAFKQWAENVGADKRVMEALEGDGDLAKEMVDDLFNLHQAMDHLEFMVGFRTDITDGSRPRSDPFTYFYSLIYTLNHKAKKFRDFQASRPRSQSPTNLSTRRMISQSPRPNGHFLPPHTSPEKDVVMVDADTSNQSHYRKDSHLPAYIKEEDTPSEPLHGINPVSTATPSLPMDSQLSPGLQVKREDLQNDSARQLDPHSSPPSHSESPNISDPFLDFSPTGSSPTTSTSRSLFSPITSSDPSSAYPSSSADERRRMHERWEQTALIKEGSTVVMPTIVPYPHFTAINHLPRITDLDGRIPPSLSTSPPLSHFDPFLNHGLPPPASARQPDS